MVKEKKSSTGVPFKAKITLTYEDNFGGLGSHIVEWEKGGLYEIWLILERLLYMITNKEDS